VLPKSGIDTRKLWLSLSGIVKPRIGGQLRSAQRARRWQTAIRRLVRRALVKAFDIPKYQSFPTRHRAPSGRTGGLYDQRRIPLCDPASWSATVPLPYQAITVEEFTKAMQEQGLDPRTMQYIPSGAVDYRNGIFPGNDDVVDRVGVDEYQALV
jgi:hypothetical protein